MKAETIVVTLVFLGMFYLFIATTTFKFRHTQATETELLLNIHNALLFKKMTMEEIRQ